MGRSIMVAVCVWVVCVSLGTAGVGIDVKVGTTGIGGDVTVGLVDRLNLRVGGNLLSWTLKDLGDANGNTADVEDLDMEINLNSASGLLDWHAFGTGFRITGGVFLNNNEVTLTAHTGQSVEIGDRTYTVSDLKGTANFDTLSPYLGIGYGNAADTESHWHFACDIGILFQGSPQIDLEAHVNDPRLQAQLDQDLAKEEADLEDDLSSFKYYPVVTVGVSYTF